MSNGKGDTPRPVNWDKYLSNYEHIFKAKPRKIAKQALEAYGMPVAMPTASSPAPRNLVDEQPK